MAGHQCYHCKTWVNDGEAHDCWTTTEAALTRDLPEDLREAWERIRETAVEFGEQRIYASHHSIMFSRQACYFFVRPKAKYLELCVFLPRRETSTRIRKVYESSTVKRAHMLRVVHRDEVEAPITNWLREAYDFAAPTARAASPRPPHANASSAKASSRSKSARSAKKRKSPGAKTSVRTRQATSPGKRRKRG